MSTATLEVTKTTTQSTPEVSLSPKATEWCRKVARIAVKRIFKVKSLTDKSVNADTLRFFLLPKTLRRRVSHSDFKTKIYLHPEFFDDKANLKKKLTKNLRNELKATIFKEIVHFVVKHPNTEFYKVMVRCPWIGARVDGAKGSTTEARSELNRRRQKKLSNKQTVTEVPTGLREDVRMWSLTEGQHVLVKNAEIFLANGKIKIARGVYNGKKLRTMLSGGASLKAKLNL